MKDTLLTLSILALACACTGVPAPRPSAQDLADGTVADGSLEVRRELETPAPAAPLILEKSAFEAAGEVSLPEVTPGEYEGLHNVFQLSETIISGGEPQGAAALEQLSAWGVRTILSVDGKAPDAQTAASLGMRYVHVPIQYSGINADEVAKLAKTFRELEAPFYVHCFHGRHRGPAAAALGRIVLDGVPRGQAIAEMRQWCATSSKYEGLYADVATAPVPSAAATERNPFAFDSEYRFEGLRAAMIPLPRHWDRVVDAAQRDWALDPDHPDLVPAREAAEVLQILNACAELPETETYADDFRVWLEQAREGAAQLVTALSAEVSAAADERDWRVEAAVAVEQVKQSCTACHATYRNH